MDNRFPLSTLLSQTLVAFIIEFDNEFEHRIPHRTSDHGISSRGDGLWLVSMAMWENCMKFMGDRDMTKTRVEALARTTTNWDGMRRWGYIQLVEGDRTPSNRTGITIRATTAGKRAQSVWRPLTEEISQRWHNRFGGATIERLKSALGEMDQKIGLSLPDCLPILKYGLFTPAPPSAKPANRPSPAANFPTNPAGPAPAHSLPALLSKVLLAFALEYEQAQPLSLAISANILRVLTVDGIPLRDIGPLAGVSRESVNMAMGILKKGWVIEGPNASGRGKAVGLTDKGLAAQSQYTWRVGDMEKHWEKVFGADLIGVLRSSLEDLVCNSSPAASAAGSPAVSPPHSPLFRGITPYPDGWRAKVPAPRILPHFPMVLHRGGFPDGS